MQDGWSRWLATGRDGGDAQTRARIDAQTQAFADRLLAALTLRPGMKLLDIGSGEGLVGFTALAREPGLEVCFTDVSAALLRLCETRAAARGSTGCQFLQTPAASLAGVADASQDAVTARSALAYEADKSAAFASIFRVLKPGGWFSIAEPLFREEALAAAAMRARLEAAPEPSLALLHRWKAAQFPDHAEAIAANPLTNYDERDLLRIARLAGFSPLHLELHIDIEPAPPRDWAAFLQSSPHPLAPCLAEILKRDYSAEEAATLEAGLRPVIEAGGGAQPRRMIYLSGQKPFLAAR